MSAEWRLRPEREIARMEWIKIPYRAAWRLVMVDEGLEPARISPFSGRWMSFVDPARAKAELAFRHEPLSSYLDKIVTAFLARPPKDTPPGYAEREHEKELARAL